MDVPVSNFDDFQTKLAQLQGKSVIFGFLLYDSRPSQQVVDRFAQEQAVWIGELAFGAGINFFFPFKSEGSDFQNPSVEIMRLFGLGPGRLPGIILFSPPQADGKIRQDHFVYLPLEEQDFNDPSVFEPIFIDLFELIRTGIEQTATSYEALLYIKNEVRKLRRRKTQRGFAAYIRKGAHIVLVEFPKALSESFAEGLGKALGERIAGY